jgi:hypothetical protein
MPIHPHWPYIHTGQPGARHAISMHTLLYDCRVVQAAHHAPGERLARPACAEATLETSSIYMGPAGSGAGRHRHSTPPSAAGGRGGHPASSPAARKLPAVKSDCLQILLDYSAHTELVAVRSCVLIAVDSTYAKARGTVLHGITRSAPCYQAPAGAFFQLCCKFISKALHFK